MNIKSFPVNLRLKNSAPWEEVRLKIGVVQKGKTFTIFKQEELSKYKPLLAYLEIVNEAKDTVPVLKEEPKSLKKKIVIPDIPIVNEEIKPLKENVTIMNEDYLNSKTKKYLVNLAKDKSLGTIIELKKIKKQEIVDLLILKQLNEVGEKL